VSRYKRFALLGMLIAPSSARGQAAPHPSSCTYERCALRVEAVPGSPESAQLVQGIEARPVETSGFFLPRIPLLESSPDSVRIPYEAFRTHAGVAHGIFAVFLGGSIVEAIAFATRSRTTAPPVSAVLATVGLDIGLGVAGLVEATRSANALQTAIARYNAALPDR
jgi:hypothetical protein